MSNSFSRYYNIYSPIHLLNPLCKILASLIYILMVFMASNLSVIFSLLVVLILLLSISNVPLKFYLKPIWGMKVLLVFIFIINFFCRIYFLDSLIMVLKVVLVVSYSSLLLFTTTTNELASGISFILKPLSLFNISVSKISMAIALSLNFIPSLFFEANKIMKSQASRGFDYKNGSYKDKIIGIKSIFIPMIVMAFKHADSVSDAMEVKQFSFNKDRSNIKGMNWYFNDAYMITGHLIILALVLVKEVVL